VNGTVSDSWATTLIGLVIISLSVVGRLYSGRFDRERIRKQVESRGGKVVDISWNPFAGGWWGPRNVRHYDVTYRTHRGAVISAVCATNRSTIYWRDIPPGFEDQDPAEAIVCVRCGAKIPARATHCSKCGWSYQG
jgi:hypothetical protein